VILNIREVLKLIFGLRPDISLFSSVYPGKYVLSAVRRLLRSLSYRVLYIASWLAGVTGFRVTEFTKRFVKNGYEMSKDMSVTLNKKRFYYLAILEDGKK
jgi:hypothetical protein